MKIVAIWATVATVGLLVMGCFGRTQIQPTPTSDTFRSDYSDLFDRAPIEFNCPAQEMTYKKLADANQVSAEGCGKRGIYVLAGYSGWVLNSVSEVDSQAPPETGTTEIPSDEPGDESPSSL